MKIKINLVTFFVEGINLVTLLSNELPGTSEKSKTNCQARDLL